MASGANWMLMLPPRKNWLPDSAAGLRWWTPNWIPLDSGIQPETTPKSRNTNAHSKAYAIRLLAGLQGGFPKNLP